MKAAFLFALTQASSSSTTSSAAAAFVTSSLQHQLLHRTALKKSVITSSSSSSSSLSTLSLRFLSTSTVSNLGHRRRNMSSSSSSSSSDETTAKALVVDPFAFRQFSEKEASESYGGTVFTNTITDFETIVNERYKNESDLKEGYAPFCKHLFIKNDFTDAQVNVLKITKDNEEFLRCCYEARTEKELPVLTRYFPKELVVSKSNPLPVAKYLDLILYSRDQINKENEAMNKKKDIADDETAPWGIVSIKAQDVDYEIPMTPITAMRNALGKEEGGSGVKLDREKYMEAFRYWNDHATVS